MNKIVLILSSFWMLAPSHAQQKVGNGIMSHLPKTPQLTSFDPINAGATSNKVNADRSLTDNKVHQVQREQLQKQNELDLITSEVQKYNRSIKQRPNVTKSYRDTTQYQRDLTIFNNALHQLKTLLTRNPVNPSLADAFYITEQAYGSPYLTRKEYDDLLGKSASFIKAWMLQQGYDLNNNEYKHLALQKFMSEKLTVSKTYIGSDGKTRIQTSEHLPFFYDFNDYEAKNDHRNFFVTKCLATGGGQCNSMPMVYLLLAEQLDAPAYLSFAPQHALVKYPKNDGEIVNYETTTNWQINNFWYEENLFISPDAIRSGIFLDTLNKQKIVANCMLDLANTYIRKMPNDNGKFIQDCLWESHFYFPKYNNIHAYFIYSSLLKGWLSAYITTHHITDPEQLKKDQWAYNLQKEYQQNEAYIKELGYRDLPEGLYADMIKNAELKGAIQKQTGLSGKIKRNLFVTPNHN